MFFLKKKKKFILHIGTNKTGTTAIQSHLFNNHEELKRQGILYPKIGVHNKGHHNLARVIMGAEPEAVDIENNWLSSFKNECEKFDKVIISSELLHTIKNPKNLIKYFPKGQTQIIIYIREHLSYLKSWYQQAVQLRTITSKFDEFIGLPETQINFSEMISKWMKVFGRQNVKVRIFERDKFVGGNVVNDIINLIPSLDLKQKDATKNKKITQANPTVSGNLLFLKLITNHFIDEKNNYRLAYELDHLSNLDTSFNGKIKINENLSNQILNKFRKDRFLLKIKYGIDIHNNFDLNEGNLCPNKITLDKDLKKIFEYSLNKKFSFGEILPRYLKFKL